MKWPRVSILGLIAAVVACGVVFAALRGGSEYWLGAFYTMIVAFLLGAVVLARYGRGTSRAFWFGFAVFGWGMFFLEANPWGGDIEASGLDLHINKSLLTTRLVLLAVGRIRMGTDDLGMIDEITRNTIGIVNLLVVLVIAAIGGLFAVAVKRRSRKTAPANPARPSHIIPKLTILLGLSLAGLGTLDRPAPAYFPKVVDLWTLYGYRYSGKWYSEHLKAMGEPNLWSLSRGDHRGTTLRFLWLPSFLHPVCVRIERKASGARLRAVVLDGHGGVHPGQVAIDRTVELDEAQWQGLERRLEAAAFWKIPTIDADEPSLTQGGTCLIEGVNDGLYHVVERQEPNPAYAALCQSMLDLTRLKMGTIWKPGHD